jgi:site-specific DNA-cytosine methylase
MAHPSAFTPILQKFFFSLATQSLARTTQRHRSGVGMARDIRCLELFSGLGGMRYALRAWQNGGEWEDDAVESKRETKRSAEVARAFDVSPSANDIYRHNFGDRVATRPIEKLSPSDLDQLQANLWTMSPPCQPYTSNGRMRDAGDVRATALSHICDVLLPGVQFKPDFLLLENVRNFERSRSRDQVVAALARCGYVFQEFLVSPVVLGIPNERARYYLLARRAETVGPFAHPEYNAEFLSRFSGVPLSDDRSAAMPGNIVPSLPSSARLTAVQRKRRRLTGEGDAATVENDKEPSIDGVTGDGDSDRDADSGAAAASAVSGEPSEGDVVPVAAQSESEVPELLGFIPGHGPSEREAARLAAAEQRLKSQERDRMAAALTARARSDTASSSTADDSNGNSIASLGLAAHEGEREWRQSNPMSQVPGYEKYEDVSKKRAEIYQNCRLLSDYLESDPVGVGNRFAVPDKTLTRWQAYVFDIVAPEDRRSSCFTKSYGQYVRGTGSVISPTFYADGAQERILIANNGVASLEQMRELRLRFFSPREVANLLGFPSAEDGFAFPATHSSKACWKLLGNSLSVTVVTELMEYLFS